MAIIILLLVIWTNKLTINIIISITTTIAFQRKKKVHLWFFYSVWLQNTLNKCDHRFDRVTVVKQSLENICTYNDPVSFIRNQVDFVFLVLAGAKINTKPTVVHMARAHGIQQTHSNTQNTCTPTHTNTHTHQHTHVGFYGLRGLSIGVMVFILYKLYVLLPYTYT